MLDAGPVASVLIENRTFDELEIGDSASLSRVLSRRDIELFAIVSGDANPAHLDPAYAETAMFHEVVAHGELGAREDQRARDAQIVDQRHPRGSAGALDMRRETGEMTLLRPAIGGRPSGLAVAHAPRSSRLAPYQNRAPRVAPGPSRTARKHARRQANARGQPLPASGPSC